MTKDLVIPLDGQSRHGGAPPSVARVRALAEENARTRRWTRVIFACGGPLERAWIEPLTAARGGFDGVTLQAPARCFTEAAELDALVAAGVETLEIDLHGHTAALHDAVAGAGDFAAVGRVLGLRAASALALATSTEIHAGNVDALVEIVGLAIDAGARVCVLRNRSEGDGLASIDAVAAGLGVALARVAEAGVAGIVRRVPPCVLGPHAGAYAADPELVDAGTRERFNCLYEALCDRSEACRGLSHSYVRRFGWEESRLRPTPRSRPWEPPPEVVASNDGERRHGHPAWLALVGALPAGVLEGVELTRRAARYPLRLPGGGALVLVLTPRDPAARALARSRSFNIAYTRVGDVDERAIARFLAPIVATIQRRDTGELSLDPREGLPPIDS